MSALLTQYNTMDETTTMPVHPESEEVNPSPAEMPVEAPATDTPVEPAHEADSAEATA